jgi:hypothetical protein
MPLEDKSVKISLDGKGSPFPETDPIEVKKDNQKIRWYADFPFTVHVDGYTDVSHGNSGGYFAQSGYFNGSAERYKYSITANGVTNDPDIIVKP